MTEGAGLFRPWWPHLIFTLAYFAERNSNQPLTAKAHDYRIMLKGATIAAVMLVAVGLLDQYLTNGRYTDVAFAMLRQMRHSFGV